MLNDKNGIYSLQLLITNQMELNESKISLLKENQNLLKNFERVLKTQKLKINNVSDATQIMMRDKKMTKLRKQIWIYTGCLFVIELLGIFGLVQLWKQGTNIMILVVLGLLLAMSVASFLTSYYYHKVVYICSNCKNEFIPSFKNFFLAMHTPKFRKLCCPSCHKKSYCLEVIR
ncbi:hypothetical protein LrDSM24759_01510 [Lactobacillus rodentium]|uniref:MerR family transcriptional regulator n=2 Tax=Lactobacillus rodentium TaxID=947835 RepID=A0A2Z6TNB9_9LACO|nr:hypothetical protein LrDSM24759_01510 [Lactobacillus rodentium]